MRTPLVVPIAIGVAFGAVSTRLGVGDSDVFWHLVAGADVLRGNIAGPDHLSWTVAGQPTSPCVSKPQQLPAPQGKSIFEKHEVAVPPRPHEQLHRRSFESFLQSMR